VALPEEAEQASRLRSQGQQELGAEQQRLFVAVGQVKPEQVLETLLSQVAEPQQVVEPRTS
jgi:hypothetical protein